MRLLFDARHIRLDHHDGISRYTAEIARAIAKITPVVFIISEPGHLDHLPAGAKTVTIHPRTSALEPITALILNRYRPDVVFSPMQTLGSLGRRFGLILTLHDMIYYRHRTPPRDLPWLLRIGWRAFHLTYIPQRITLDGADLVCTVSEKSRDDFAAAKLTKRPVFVAPGAPRDLGVFGATASVASTTRRNLVYMGSFMPYKNVETLLRGMAWLPGRTLHILSTIEAGRKVELEALVPACAAVVFHNGVSDEKYAALLADDAVLVTASIDEGYGLPVAEALAFGVPAVVSDLAVFREIAGDGALFFAANDARAFARAVESLDDPEIATALVERGRTQSEKYSWNASARIILDAALSIRAKRG
ncbi:MAG: glycosyltransferase family 4 protein [Burkholderiaceae bacterium]|nr:glycosyltransferase family 4 protein [Microbacteriaceae bacterium]